MPTYTASPALVENIVDDDVPINPSDWLDPMNAVSQDDTGATSTITAFISGTKKLRATQFDFSAIPANQTILGIEALFRCKDESASVARVATARLNLNGVPIGTDLGDLTGFPASYSTLTYGGTANLWGTGGLTLAQVQDSTFGVGIVAGVSSPPATNTPDVDHIQLRITTDEPIELTGVPFELVWEGAVSTVTISTTVLQSIPFALVWNGAISTLTIGETKQPDDIPPELWPWRNLHKWRARNQRSRGSFANRQD